MHPKYLCNWLILILVATACSPATSASPPAETTTEAAIVTTVGDNGVIFPASMVEEGWWFEMGYREAGQSWTPDPGHVASLEAALVPFLQTADDPWLRPDPPIWERVSGYQRQYVGLLEEGRQIIYGNYFCESGQTDWQQEFVSVADGGDCYFQLKYDVTTEEIYALHVNGES